MNGGAGIFQPVIVRVSGDPVPGITAGMVDGLKGMVAGGKRTVKVTPAAGFGGTTVVAPYAVVPGDSTLTYEIEVRAPACLLGGGERERLHERRDKIQWERPKSTWLRL